MQGNPTTHPRQERRCTNVVQAIPETRSLRMFRELRSMLDESFDASTDPEWRAWLTQQIRKLDVLLGECR